MHIVLHIDIFCLIFKILENDCESQTMEKNTVECRYAYHPSVNVYLNLYKITDVISDLRPFMIAMINTSLAVEERMAERDIFTNSCKKGREGLIVSFVNQTEI